MVRLTIKLLVLGVLLHAGYRIVPVFYTHFQFRDALTEMATFSNRRTPDEVLDRAATIAKEYHVPLNREDFSVRRERQFTSIQARYSEKLEYLPRQYYPWEFIVDVEGEPRFGEFTP